MKKYLIIGDVHADFEPFQKAVAYAQENDLHIISVGDLIDGGPDGAKCCSLMLDLLKKGKASIVKGNHEHKIIRYIDGANVKIDWNRNTEKGQILKKAYKVACNYFNNILTPDSDQAHHDHFHFDNGFGLKCYFKSIIK